MSVLRHPVFLLSVLLFCLNQALEQLQLYLWPLHTHLDDLLCLPIVLTIILAAERVYFRNSNFVLPKSYTVSTVLLFSIVFELLLPMLTTKYTSDVWDVVAYAVGAVVFCITINQHISPERREAE